MAKTMPPGVVKLAHGTYRVNVVPDVFDERDLDYRPRLQPLPKQVDVRPKDRYVLEQAGNSCTGHAVAAMINAVLTQQGDAVHVSPYMLYRMARRYDEFEGEEDEGSSLRGALKGWYYHGVLPDKQWPRLDPLREPDIDHDDRLVALAMRRPLGAFYRVGAFRLDDMQSAVNELSAIVVSASVHEGWVAPTRVRRDGKVMHVIEKPVGARVLGGHAFTIVGYNDIGFLVQNSWGRKWGRGGFATLPYDDWLESGYDAWVARPGVPSIVSSRQHTKTVTVTGGALAEGPGPDLARLTRHVVNLGNDGVLSQNGRFVSTPNQVHQVFERMADYHAHWAGQPDGAAEPSRVVLYAHGGLNSEGTGLTIAQRQLNWWLNNRVYPVTFAWQTGPVETLTDQLTDVVRRRLPAGGLGFNLVEQFDRFVEKFARSNVRWMWDEMKENAALAAKPIPQSKAPVWPPDTEAAQRRMAELPGASLVADRLARYVVAAPAGRPVEVHLVGHSAGSIFLAGVLDRLAELGVPVASLTYLAPAIRTDVWMRQVLPHLRDRRVARFASFGLDDARELDDTCGAGGVNVYQKSLLYLVSRALERTAKGQAEVPLVGMARFAATAVGGTTLAEAVRGVGGDLVWAPSEQPAVSRTDSTKHGGFDDDGPTMTSVMLRVLGRAQVEERCVFRPNVPLSGPEPPERAPAVGRAQPTTAEVAEAGTVPVSRMAPPARKPGRAKAVPPARPVKGRRTDQAGPVALPEAREAPESTSQIMDALLRSGWEPADG